jgi:hypothetical protein|tara:strand:+ start:2190 stop:2405 length:216 start_codon:yes stop_codon:yes gene_type:complete
MRLIEHPELEFTIEDKSVTVILDMSKVLYDLDDTFVVPTEKEILDMMANIRRQKFVVIEGGKPDGEKTSSV